MISLNVYLLDPMINPDAYHNAFDSATEKVLKVSSVH